MSEVEVRRRSWLPRGRIHLGPDSEASSLSEGDGDDDGLLSAGVVIIGVPGDGISPVPVEVPEHGVELHLLSVEVGRHLRYTVA